MVRPHRTQQVRGSNPLCSSAKKGTQSGAFLCAGKWSFTPDQLRMMDKLPGSPGACKARAVVEHTRKPGGLPRPERRGHLRAGTPAPAGGEWGRQISERPRRHTLPSSTESESNLVRFLFCIDFQYPRALRHCTLASDATALPGAKQHQKVKKPKHA